MNQPLIETDKRLAIIIVNYRTPEFVEACLVSLDGQVDDTLDCVVVVDNASADGSADRIEHFIRWANLESWVRLVRAPSNGGFSAGNNLGIQSVRAELYFLLNSDTIVRPGAIRELIHAARSQNDAGMIAPRLEWPDGMPQQSCFPMRTPSHEFFAAAGTHAVEKFLRHNGYAYELCDSPRVADWVSFAAILIKREVLDRVGPLDEGYFMYFEDMDYCSVVRNARFRILYWPDARVVHLRGGSSPVKKLTSERKRPPVYWYASRARYYGKHFGTLGVWRANLLWHAGRIISWVRELAGNKQPHANMGQWRDIWTNALDPLRLPDRS
jgi:N-acetylglucosaminyl-diphospho-decaprenol L-rhamnosyltransferase